MKLEEIARLPADTLLADELSNDDGVIETANLDKSQTGVDGVIWISTMMPAMLRGSNISSGLDELSQVFRSPWPINREW